MAGAFTPTAPGSVGDNAPGWTIQEDASSHVPGDGSGSTGTTSFTSESKSNATFLMDNPGSFAVTNKDGSAFGSLTGTVTSVSNRGIASSLSLSTALGNFAVDRYVPSVASGHPASALDLACQLVGYKFCTLSNVGGVYWSARGHGSGFDYQGNLVPAQDLTQYVPQNTALLNYVLQDVNASNALTITKFNNTTNTPRAVYALGSSPTVVAGLRTIVMHKNASVNYSWFTATYGPTNATNNTGKSFRVYCDYVAQTINITGTYYSGGSLQTVTQSASIATVLSGGTNTQLIFDMNWINSTTFNLTAYIANQSALGTVVSVSTGNLTTALDPSAFRWQVAGVMTDFYQLNTDQTFTPSSLMATYTTSANYGTVAAMTPASNYVGAPFVAYNGSVWDYLNQVSSATGVDFYFGGSVTTVRPTGSVPVVIDSFVPSPTLSVNRQGVARYVNIKNYNSSVIQNQIVYDADQTSDSWSFPTGTTTTNIITTTSSLDFIYNPIPTDDYPTFLNYRALSLPGGLATATRTNIVRNPDLEANSAVHWTATGSSTIAASTTQHSVGAYSLAVTTNLATSSGVISAPVSTTAYRNVSFVGSVDIWVPSGKSVTVNMDYSNGTGTTIVSAGTFAGTSAWQRIPIPAGVVPNDATTEPYISIFTGAGTSYVFYVDAADLEVGTLPINPFSGNTVSSDSVQYAWTGIFNDSASTATPNGFNGSYVMSDSANVTIPSYDWVANGGSVTLSVIDPNHIQMIVTAPPVPGHPGPYMLKALDTSATARGTLLIVGAGVSSAPVVTNFPTGADPSFIPVLQAGDIDNVAIGSAARQYTAAMWSGSIHAGPSVRLTATVPLEVFSGFGLVGGSTFFYQNSRWRVVNAVINNMTVDITCYQYTTAGDFETAWTGKLISDLETAWSGKREDDFNIQPLALTP